MPSASSVGGEGSLMEVAGMGQCVPLSPFVTMAHLWPLQCPRWASLAHTSSTMAYDDSSAITYDDLSTAADIHSVPSWIADRRCYDDTGCDHDVHTKKHVGLTATTTSAATTPRSGLVPSFSSVIVSTTAERVSLQKKI